MEKGTAFEIHNVPLDQYHRLAAAVVAVQTNRIV
jgi:hypothetical protein